MKYLIFTLAPGQNAPEPYQAAAVFFYNDWKRANVTPILARTEDIAAEAAQQWIDQELARVHEKCDAMTVRKPRRRRDEPAPESAAQPAPAPAIPDFEEEF